MSGSWERLIKYHIGDDQLLAPPAFLVLSLSLATEFLVLDNTYGIISPFIYSSIEEHLALLFFRLIY
jgi:hypothetical protein